MQTWESLILFTAFIIIELILFHNFYSRRSGKVAVYTSWYAGIIDVLAMISGVSIMGLSLFGLYNPWMFNLPIPTIVFIIFFVFGSWQFGIHLVKMIIRSTRKIIEKIKSKKASQESLSEFGEEYEKARDEYFEDIKDDGKRNESVKNDK